MKRPSFQFYPADWRNNSNLRRCSEAARGAWMDVLCVLHDSDEYGVCRWPLAELARAAGVPVKLLKELADKKVLKGADAGGEAYVYIPRHAGQDGEPVTLVVCGDGPCWYSSRFVRDEWVRLRRGGPTRFDAENQPPKQQPKASPKGGLGGPVGDGATSSSSSTSTEEYRKETSSPSSSSPQAASPDAGEVVPPVDLLPPAPARNPSVPFVEVMLAYNRLCPSMPRAELSELRKKTIRARWQERVTAKDENPITWFETLFTKAEASDFLAGRTPSPSSAWRCGFDWLVGPKNAPKVIEGNYDNNRATRAPQRFSI